MKISDFLVEGRGRPVLVEEVLVERREASVDVKERVVEEEISRVLVLGLRMPYRWESADDIFGDGGVLLECVLVPDILMLLKSWDSRLQPC